MVTLDNVNYPKRSGRKPPKEMVGSGGRRQAPPGSKGDKISPLKAGRRTKIKQSAGNGSGGSGTVGGCLFQLVRVDVVVVVEDALDSPNNLEII